MFKLVRGGSRALGGVGFLKKGLEGILVDDPSPTLLFMSIISLEIFS
jgi:hypothetical protein